MAAPSYNENRLSEAFRNAVANSRDERIQDFYGSDIEPSGIIERSEQAAKILLYGARDVVSGKSVEQAQQELDDLLALHDAPENEILQKHVEQAMDEEVGRSLVTMQATAEERMWKLILMGKQAIIDSRTSEYLKHVSRCYLLGLDEQCVIMCRSALEAAFLDAIPDSVCSRYVRKEPPPGRDAPEYTLRDRITAAEAQRTTTLGICKLARFVKNVANDFIHPEREDRRDLDEEFMALFVMEAIEVVQALAQASR